MSEALSGLDVIALDWGLVKLDIFWLDELHLIIMCLKIRNRLVFLDLLVFCLRLVEVETFIVFALELHILEVLILLVTAAAPHSW